MIGASGARKFDDQLCGREEENRKHSRIGNGDLRNGGVAFSDQFALVERLSPGKYTLKMWFLMRNLCNVLHYRGVIQYWHILCCSITETASIES
jgi:hypothetical protein